MKWKGEIMAYKKLEGKYGKTKPKAGDAEKEKEKWKKSTINGIKKQHFLEAKMSTKKVLVVEEISSF